MEAKEAQVYLCTGCRTRFKLRPSPHGGPEMEVVWILLDRSFYQSQDTVTVCPLFCRIAEDLRCPACWTGNVKPMSQVMEERAKLESSLGALRRGLDAGNLTREEFDEAAGRCLARLAEIEVQLTER